MHPGRFLFCLSQLFFSCEPMVCWFRKHVLFCVFMIWRHLQPFSLIDPYDGLWVSVKLLSWTDRIIFHLYCALALITTSGLRIWENRYFLCFCLPVISFFIYSKYVKKIKPFFLNFCLSLFGRRKKEQLVFQFNLLHFKMNDQKTHRP